MSKFRLISVDMFQTLVDIHPRSLEAGRRMLGSIYTPELAQQCWDEATALITAYFREKPLDGAAFRNVKYGFEACYRQLWQEKGFDLDSFMSARILAEEHGKAEIFKDAEEFINAFGRIYPVCLVSDADTDMIEPLLNHFSFDRVFISEECKSYKIQSEMFREVIKKYSLKPEEILHIGDGYPDIAGAAAAGVKTCWINRGRRAWLYDRIPDYAITSFDELKNII